MELIKDQDRNAWVTLRAQVKEETLNWSWSLYEFFSNTPAWGKGQEQTSETKASPEKNCRRTEL